MSKFDKVYKSIITQSSNPPIKKLSYLGLCLLQQNWTKVKFESNCWIEKFDKKTKKYVNSKYNLKITPWLKESGGRYYHYATIEGERFFKEEQVSIFENDINMYPIKLTFEHSYSKGAPNSLKSINYDSAKNVTTLVFNLDQSLELYPDYIHSGTISMIVPGNILNPTPAKINFNCKDFDNYLKSRLPRKWFWDPNNKYNDDYFVQSFHTEYEDGDVIVVINRCTIKAYGDGYSYTDDYEYEAGEYGIYDLVSGYYSGSYSGKQNSKLGYEIAKALCDYTDKKFGRNKPAKLIVRIQGEAD